jgi:hypothetical protein
MDDDLVSEFDACHSVGLTASQGHRLWLRSLVKPVIAPDAAGHVARRYRREDLDAAAIIIATGLTRHAHNLRNE